MYASLVPKRVGHTGGFAERSPDRVAVEIGVPVAANSEEDHQRAVFDGQSLIK